MTNNELCKLNILTLGIYSILWLVFSTITKLYFFNIFGLIFIGLTAIYTWDYLLYNRCIVTERKVFKNVYNIILLLDLFVIYFLLPTVT